MKCNQEVCKFNVEKECRIKERIQKQHITTIKMNGVVETCKLYCYKPRVLPEVGHESS